MAKLIQNILSKFLWKTSFSRCLNSKWLLIGRSACFSKNDQKFSSGVFTFLWFLTNKRITKWLAIEWVSHKAHERAHDERDSINCWAKYLFPARGRFRYVKDAHSSIRCLTQQGQRSVDNEKACNLVTRTGHTFSHPFVSKCSWSPGQSTDDTRIDEQTCW